MVERRRLHGMDVPARRRMGRASIATGVTSLVASGAFAYAWAMDMVSGGLAGLRLAGITLAMGVGFLVAGRIMVREAVPGSQAAASAWPRDEAGRIQWPCHACDSFNPVDYGFCIRCGTVAKGDRIQVAAAADRRAHRA